MTSETLADRQTAEHLSSGERVLSFDDYDLVPQRRLLLHAGSPVRVGTRALDILCLLVEQRGELVSKEQLMSAAWPDTYVHESNLKVNIAALRRTLPSPNPQLPYIATVPGRGYRFTAQVRIGTKVSAVAEPVLAGATNLVLPAAPLIIGRDGDVAALTISLTLSRFLTIVGPAGVGKTAVALAVARRAAERFEHGAVFVDLSMIGDPRLVCPAIASALGAGGHASDLLAGIVETLRHQRRLLILDNCEHVVCATSVVADHLRAALPEIGILATSREPLRSQYESVHGLAPLACPPDGQELGRDAALAFPAVVLFVARANTAVGYELAQDDVAAVGAICRRLDGIPLAIELAAPRLTSHDVRGLLARLEQSFEWLNYGPRNAPARQQALLATLDWSYRLLSDREAMVLRLLSVFAGSFSLEDAVGLAGDSQLLDADLAWCVSNLAAKSLLASSFADGQLRYRLLETTRSYAAERLKQAGEEPWALMRHAELVLQFFERAEHDWRWRLPGDWGALYAARLNDLRKAIDWALSAPSTAGIGLRLTAAAIPLWEGLSLVDESRLRVGRALSCTQDLGDLEPVFRLKLRLAYAWALTFAETLGPQAEEAWRESLTLAEDAGSVEYRLRALWGWSVLQSFSGRHRQVQESLSAFAAIVRDEDEADAGPDGERLAAMTAFYRGDLDGAYARLNALAREHREAGHRPGIARFQLDRFVAIRASLAIVAWTRGNAAQAQRAVAAAVSGAVEIGHDVSLANALALAALPVALWSGQIDAAQAHLAALIENHARRDIGIFGPVSRFFAGAIQHARGDADGVDAMRSAVEALTASQFLGRLPYYALTLAQAALDNGRTEVALAAITLARDHALRQDEQWCMPEVLRVMGLLQWREGDHDTAEATLRQAISLAETLGAWAIALKAAACLVERRRETGGLPDAAALLRALCARVDQDGANPDLGRAFELLDLLDSAPVRQAAAR
ncbi:winged helix-turn-helix domain-containing protein [Caulobacter sp. 1776]|uniref:ATP-binding protein n=1 Tax=Caulobacter sp. 1776 TaxID=3156420 RepID=UPI0033908478